MKKCQETGNRFAPLGREEICAIESRRLPIWQRRNRYSGRKGSLFLIRDELTCPDLSFILVASQEIRKPDIQLNRTNP